MWEQGGTATPLVVGAISAVSGAVIAGTQSVTGQYVETGDLSKTNWGAVGKDAFVGGVSGFITGYLGAGLSNAVTSKLSNIAIGKVLLNSNSTVTRIATNAVIGAGSETVSGIGTRFAGTMITSGGDIKESAGSAFNVYNIVFDAALGGVSSGVKGLKKPGLADGKLPDSLPDELPSGVNKGASGANDIINKVKNGDITLESTKHKGNFGEMVQDSFYEGIDKKMNRISKDRVTSLDDKIHQGIDGVYEDPTGGPPKFVISEAKYGTSKLSTLKDGTPQMSDKWIADRLEEAVGAKKAKEIILEMTLNPDNVQTTLINIDAKGKAVESLLKNGKK